MLPVLVRKSFYIRAVECLMMQDFRALRRKYSEIISNFINSAKKFQILNSKDERSSLTKAQIDVVLSYKGWQNKVAVLDIGDSVHLINIKNCNLLPSTRRSPRARRRARGPWSPITPHSRLSEEPCRVFGGNVGADEAASERLYIAWRNSHSRDDVAR